MAWLATLTFGAISLGVAVFILTLIVSLEAQPEYPTIMTHTIRLLGGVIAVAATVFGVLLLVATVQRYFGL